MRAGEGERQPGPVEWFEGSVELESVASNLEDTSVSLVHFHNGARTNWHEHEREQILCVIEGECRVATDSTAEERLFPGDRIYLPGGERHWHGAAPGVTMAHLSITSGPSPSWDGPPPAR